jgi:hypothetical protein
VAHDWLPVVAKVSLAAEANQHNEGVIHQTTAAIMAIY